MELNVPYDLHLINLGKNEQFAPEFLKISPNNKIPAIIDQNPPSEFGEGAHPIFESGVILQYFADYKKEVDRLLEVMNKRLGEYKYLAGDNYTIASYNWVIYNDKVKAADTPFPNIKAWLERISERPAVKKAMEKATFPK
ncbi:4979_t:CDS:2 [Funneliformis caledonium]|uniref:4979_t:CDS:1 n=1 Tax=Funneliformis caledonium TaxID=1117310 RepID=A0A9N9BJI7_9GLOM|nr:4979_t:CDS:2 [Funneliformis caledonium]